MFLERSFHGRFMGMRHKFWELQTSWYPKAWTEYFSFHLRFNRKCDHAGFLFEFDMMALSISFQIYDHRHWNHDRGDWEHGEYPRTYTELDL